MDEPESLMMQAFDGCLAKCKRVGWESLSPVERILVLGIDFYFQVSTGGIDLFYQNPTGDRAVETVWALEQLGARKAAEILRRCNEAFPGGQPLTYQPDRCDQVTQIMKARRFPAVALRAGAREWDTVYTLLVAFIERNE